ncbi:MAG TPA: Uma2 family endonuclease [Pilimelia sp.]|nr:Uma2 family endonuclease [Pilimelia sp.]
MTAAPIGDVPPPVGELPPPRADIPPPGGWTVDDLDAAPPDGHRREILDGVLIVSPTPTNVHQTIALRLGSALEESCPDRFDVTQAVEVRINRRRSFVPDVLVTTAEAARRGSARFEPREVVLVVEIVSAGSQSMDRVLKPALYAQAGIPHFWRVETECGLTVHTYTLDAPRESYAETGAWTDVVDVAEPWPIKLPTSRLTPRFLTPPE